MRSPTIAAILAISFSVLGAQTAPVPQTQSAATAKPTPVPESVRKALLAAREAVWRGEFLQNPGLLPPEAIGIVEWTEDWKHRDEIIAGAKTANANGINIRRLEFPRTEIQLYGDTAILYSTYMYEAEFNGESAGVETGRSTEIFIRRNGKWLNAGWHIDSGTHLVPRADLKKTLQDLRESIWRAYFANDSVFLKNTLRPDMVAADDGPGSLKTREDILTDARKLANRGFKISKLEFPHTEIRIFEQTAILFSDFRWEGEADGKAIGPVTGHTTEIFIYRDGKWYESGWQHNTTPALPDQNRSNF
ncbi:MAG TPA: nuclear transport factor 2 family protein [Candidatus Angelobacter sp.]|nr:nuclear transport factor 2 family protein [Candidatus Angelobacter sp.]